MAEPREIGIHEIEGFQIGHAQDEAGATGCTVVLCERGATAGVDVRGRAPATRETELLRPGNTVERVHAVMLSGGSAFGLDACAGAMAFLEERGIGFDAGLAVVPIVCGASLFDLFVGDSQARPDKAMGYAACENAGAGALAEGNVGAGTGATVGKYLGPARMMKSGFGAYALQAGDVKCGALVAVNAFGDVFDADTGRAIAGLLNEEGTALADTERLMCLDPGAKRVMFGGNTTLGCILTDARLTKAEAGALASVAHDGFARAIRPVHTTADGDAIFALGHGDKDASADALGVLAAMVMARAVARAVRAAKSAYGLIGADAL
ncbi:MAG: P1 family peptidase [Clostridiales Family XIII bacterium]|jgi:L-aminopeptidase/D-esterase-like protein|nr:P1 family peptidase [Clostridiales Family XIII bacterium]